jgi:signal transduction histidine kinase/CheY-like chemotaxis protein
MAILQVSIATRLTLGLILLAGLTLAVSGIAFFSFDDLRRDFEQIAGSSLPDVTATSRLSRQAQSIVSNAPELVVADTQFTRRAVAHRNTEQFAALDAKIRQLKDQGVKGELFDRLVSLRNSLSATLDSLDRSVEQKLDLEQAAHGHFQRLVGVQDELRALAQRAGAADSGRAVELDRLIAAGASRDALLAASRKLDDLRQHDAAFAAWLANADRITATMFGTFGITHPALLESAHQDIAAGIAAGDGMIAGLSDDFAGHAAAVQKTMHEIADGDGGLLATRAGEFAIARQIEDALSNNKAFADRFDSTADAVSRTIEDNVLDTVRAADLLTERQTWLILALVSSCVCGAGLILLYLRRSVIRRLYRLQEAMQAHVDGRVTTIDTEGTDELAEMGRALEFFVRTISERRAELASSESRLRSVTENLPGAVFRLIREEDGTLVIPFLTLGLRDLLNIPPAAIINRPDAAFDLVPAGEQARLRAAIEYSAAEQAQLFFECQALPQQKWLRFTAFPRPGEAGQTIWDGLMLDSTEWKQADLAKRAFVSTVSHELRTPLASIQGSLGLVAGGAMGVLPDGVKRLLDIASANCQRLTRLINDILDIEKIEQNHIAFAVSRQRLAPLLAQAIEANRGHGLARGITLMLTEPPPDDLAVDVDPDRFMQVMTNLLSNAVKYSHEGGIVDIGVTAFDRDGAGPKLEARSALSDESPSQVAHGSARNPGATERTARIFVRDRGIGIPKAFRPFIFDRFTQADSSDRRAKSGTGLGLNIAKAIVDRFGGKISFDTADGAGSTFYVELPISTMPPPPQPLRILQLDDDEELSRLLSMLVGGHAEILPTRTAAEAWRLLEQTDFDLIILDLELPNGAGRSLLQKLNEPGPFGAIPTLIIADAETRRPANSVRMPASASHAELLDQIERLLDRRAAGLPPKCAGLWLN